jgi:hypothetical protein
MVSIQRILFNQRIFDRRVYLFFAAVLGIILFDLFAIAHALYFTHWWLDIAVHLIGGMILALLLYYLAYANTRTATLLGLLRTREHMFSLMVFWVLVVALGWEVVEFIYGRTFLTPNYALDLFLDICSTSGGAVLAYVYVRHRNTI